MLLYSYTAPCIPSVSLAFPVKNEKRKESAHLHKFEGTSLLPRIANSYIIPRTSREPRTNSQVLNSHTFAYWARTNSHGIRKNITF
jgi:hypothetical protein